MTTWITDTRAPDTDGSDLTARLREAITSGRFMPNERLIEADLVRTVDANRSNIRIALAMLDQEGLVVRERTPGGACSPRFRQRGHRDCRSAAGDRGHGGATGGSSCNRLRLIIADMRAAFDASDFIAVLQLNAKLHGQIQRIAANATASRLLRTLKSQIMRLQYRAILLPGRAERSLAEHTDIVDAICAGDGDLAESAMRR